MRTMLFAAILTTMMFSACALGANSDPRKCTISGTPASLSYCANLAARMAVVHKVGNSDVSCHATNAKLLAWACSFKNEARTGAAAVTFRALSSGWHTSVKVA